MKCKFFNNNFSEEFIETLTEKMNEEIFDENYNLFLSGECSEPALYFLEKGMIEIKLN